MKRGDVLFLVAVAVIILLLAPWINDFLEKRGFWTRSSSEQKSAPPLCSNFTFERLLQRGTALQAVKALDTTGDGLEECVVLYSEAPRPGSNRRPVYGWVYHFQMRGEPDLQAGVIPVSQMQRHDLLTDYGARVQLGSIPGTQPHGNPSADNVEAQVMNADGRGRPELVILNYNAVGELTRVSVFRWRGDKEGYQLVGYVRGDWLRIEPNPFKGWIKEIIVYDRVYPVDATGPDRVVSLVFTWQDGKLMLDPHRKVTDVPR
jgi:hypothetical protein